MSQAEENLTALLLASSQSTDALDYMPPDGPSSEISSQGSLSEEKPASAKETFAYKMFGSPTEVVQKYLEYIFLHFEGVDSHLWLWLIL